MTKSERSWHMSLVTVLIMIAIALGLWLWWENLQQSVRINELEDQLIGATVEAVNQAEGVLASAQCARTPEASKCVNAMEVMNRYSSHGDIRDYECNDEFRLIVTFTDGAVIDSRACNR